MKDLSFKAGIFMIFLSVMLLIAAVASLLYSYIPDPYQWASLQKDAWEDFNVNAYDLNSAQRQRDNPPEYHPDAASPSPQDVSDLPISMPVERVFPYQWLALPLATIGIIALIFGLKSLY